MTPKLGRLVTMRAADVWASEAQVFTPWLSQNLELLAEALQIEELELKGTEVAAGDFRLDILAEDPEGKPVLIENQFGPTDHKHLGQVISYVASQEGGATVVWVAERFKEDHRAAIDWLNRNTGEQFDFFAIEIEALRIDDSDPAPFFNVVSKPNAWARSVSNVTRQAATGEMAHGDQVRLGYWSAFGEYLKSQKSTFTIRRPNTDHWYSFAIGRAGIVISATVNTMKRRIGVELYLSKDPLKAGIKQLEAERSAIEIEFGEQLEWQELPSKKASRIVIYRTNVDPSDEANFSDLHKWMLERMEAFRHVFKHRVKLLVLDGSVEDDADTEPN